MCRATTVTVQELPHHLCRLSSGQHFRPLRDPRLSLSLKQDQFTVRLYLLAWVLVTHTFCGKILKQHCLRICPLGQQLISTFIKMLLWGCYRSEDTAENKISILPLGLISQCMLDMRMNYHLKWPGELYLVPGGSAPALHLLGRGGVHIIHWKEGGNRRDSLFINRITALHSQSALLEEKAVFG